MISINYNSSTFFIQFASSHVSQKLRNWTRIPLQFQKLFSSISQHHSGQLAIDSLIHAGQTKITPTQNRHLLRVFHDFVRKRFDTQQTIETFAQKFANVGRLIAARFAAEAVHIPKREMPSEYCAQFYSRKGVRFFCGG